MGVQLENDSGLGRRHFTVSESLNTAIYDEQDFMSAIQNKSHDK